MPPKGATPASPGAIVKDSVLTCVKPLVQSLNAPEYKSRFAFLSSVGWDLLGGEAPAIFDYNGSAPDSPGFTSDRPIVDIKITVLNPIL